MSECRFWMVWNPQGCPPRMKHETRESAETEAKRLAGRHAGQSFYVLAAVTVARKLEPVSLTELEPAPLDDDGIPF